MGYHLKEITKGVYGELSKVREELEEAEDGLQQNNKILVLVELSDLYGALEEYVHKHHGITMEDLKIMSDATKRAFGSGRRTASEEPADQKLHQAVTAHVVDLLLKLRQDKAQMSALLGYPRWSGEFSRVYADMRDSLIDRCKDVTYFLDLNEAINHIRELGIISAKNEKDEELQTEVDSVYFEIHAQDVIRSMEEQQYKKDLNRIKHTPLYKGLTLPQIKQAMINQLVCYYTEQGETESYTESVEWLYEQGKNYVPLEYINALNKADEIITERLKGGIINDWKTELAFQEDETHTFFQRMIKRRDELKNDPNAPNVVPSHNNDITLIDDVYAMFKTIFENKPDVYKYFYAYAMHPSTGIHNMGLALLSLLSDAYDSNGHITLTEEQSIEAIIRFADLSRIYCIDNQSIGQQNHGYIITRRNILAGQDNYDKKY